MLRKLPFFLYLMIVVSTVSGQNYDPTSPPNTYQSADNPYYWKNKMPRPGYWQQDVHYNIKANIDDRKNEIQGNQLLTYWNNSPDTIFVLYFHLYQNAYRAGSYLESLRRATGNSRISKKKGYPPDMGTEISRFEIGYPGTGKLIPTEFEIDNTILRCKLKNALLPGQSIEIGIDFITRWDPANGRRFAMFRTHGHKHFNGTHWYPRISVYDQKFRWTTDQHLGSEFYGDFGTFDVELTFPNHYIVEATGNLLNSEEVLPGDLREKLDIKNFANKEWGSPPSEIVKPDGTSKTWKFYAENVHDFTFTANPTYRIGETIWNGIHCIAIVQEAHASGWQNASDYTAKIIETFSRDFGMYAYHKIVVADARSGMEYQMITLCSGRDPTYRGLFVHEVAHSWFYGMVGSNETYRATLDEGFSQFLTGWGLFEIEGSKGYELDYGNAYKNKFKEPANPVYNSVYQYYLTAAMRNEDGTLNTHSDYWFVNKQTGGGFSQVYRKTGTMLYNLQYVLGDELFLAAMKNYVSKWSIAHPYPEDFRNSIIEFTKVDLNWFFDQWMETDKTIDYKLANISKIKSDTSDLFRVKFRRIGRMQMPLDFTVEARDGRKHNFHIPNTDFIKNSDALVLPKWYGWDNLNKTYTAELQIPTGIRNVTIDTTNRLADINQLNNVKKLPLALKFDSRINNASEWRDYTLKARPDIWYNSYDGFKAGFHLEGSYMDYRDVFSIDTWINTGLLQGDLDDVVAKNEYDRISYIISYATPLNTLIKRSSLLIDIRHIDGLDRVQGGIEIQSENKKTTYYSHFIYMRRENTTDLDYPLYRNEWLSARNNNSIVSGLRHNYRFRKGTGKIDVNLRSSAMGSDYNFSQASATAINKYKLGKFDVATRGFVQYALGNNFASETNLFLYGANPEELSLNKFTRSRAFFPEDWLEFGDDINHFHHGGGLNLRGYSGYLIPTVHESGELRFIYKGNTGASASIEVDFDRFLPFRPRLTRNWLHFDPYFFADAGVININNVEENLELSALRADAGFGLAVTIKKFGPLEQVKPLTMRVDFPVFINRSPSASPEYVDFRWVIGVGRSF